MLHTHSQRLENWLGAGNVEHLSRAMRDWYGPPIPVRGVPGAVYASRGGDFVGHVDAGRSGSALDRAEDYVRRAARQARVHVARGWRLAGRPRHGTLHGFASLSALIAAATSGKRYEYVYQKVGVTGVVAATNTLWYVGNQPAAGANGGAAPGGTAMNDATVGTFLYTNPTSPDTLHFVSGFVSGSVAPNTLLLYDRLFSVTKTMSSSATESVTGVPTRYQGTTGGAADSAEGNFLVIECRTALSATAHNWTTCLYTDQSGNGTVTLPSVTGNSSNIQYRLDQPTSQWFCPLATGDTGIQQLDQMQCSSAAVTGAIDFTIGHPIAWMPCPIANMICDVDGINTAFNLTRIFDDACLALLEVIKPATTATTYTGTFTAVAG